MIGILGGMGTQAGLDFCSKLAKLNRGKSDQNYPLFLLYNKSNIPDRKQNLDKGQSEQPAKAMGEAKELSVDDQMRISRDHNRKSPEEKKAANSKLLGAIKKVKREKDTRTDAQKMTDATGPRPGSRYRGD